MLIGWRSREGGPAWNRFRPGSGVNKTTSRLDMMRGCSFSLGPRSNPVADFDLCPIVRSKLPNVPSLIESVDYRKHSAVDYDRAGGYLDELSTRLYRHCCFPP